MKYLPNPPTKLFSVDMRPPFWSRSGIVSMAMSTVDAAPLFRPSLELREYVGLPEGVTIKRLRTTASDSTIWTGFVSYNTTLYMDVVLPLASRTHRSQHVLRYLIPQERNYIVTVFVRLPKLTRRAIQFTTKHRNTCFRDFQLRVLLLWIH